MRPRALLARFVPAAAATIVVGLVVATHPLSPLPRGVAIACAVASWAAPLVFSRRDLRTHASVVAAITAVTAAGQVDAGLLYGIASGAFLLVTLVAMRATRQPSGAASSRVGTSAQPRSAPPLVVAVLFGTAGIITAGLVVGLPRLAARIEGHFAEMFSRGNEEATAFSTAMTLGATRGMTKSSTIVMRIDGERPEYLRGAVYNRYYRRYWGASPAGAPRHTAADTPSFLGDDATQITLTRAAPNGDDMRWFLPPNACDMVADSGRLEADGFGITRRPRSSAERQTIRFRTKGCANPPPPIAPPSADDLDVPASVAERLHPIALDWTSGKDGDRAKLDAIVHQLSKFSYSLFVPRDDRLDPIVDFVTVHRAGHCEFFASAMALMARTQGIPARVVGGYHVSEVNPITGRTVVRDRNAHTWVEAWIDGRWQPWDPTPASEPLTSGSKILEHLGDLVTSATDRALFTINQLGPFGASAVSGALVAFYLAARSAVTALARHRRRRPRAGERSRALPAFLALDDALTTAGHARDASEPLETFARRLSRLDVPWAEPVSRALLGYAGLRYGEVGDARTVVSDVERATQSVRSSTNRPNRARGTV